MILASVAFQHFHIIIIIIIILFFTSLSSSSFFQDSNFVAPHVSRGYILTKVQSSIVRAAFTIIYIFVKKLYVLSSYVDKMLVAQKVRRKIFLNTTFSPHKTLAANSRWFLWPGIFYPSLIAQNSIIESQLEISGISFTKRDYWEKQKRPLEAITTLVPRIGNRERWPSSRNPLTAVSEERAAKRNQGSK